MTTHAVLDLETLDVVPRAAIASVGLAIVKDSEIIATYHWASDYKEQRRSVSKDTYEWWRKQPEALQRRSLGGKLPLAYVFGQLAGKISRYDVDLVWGNGAAFDNAIIHDAAHELGLPRLWPYKQDMCLRTLRQLVPAVNDIPFEGVPHDAEDDALHQAEQLIAAYKALKITS